MLMGNQEPVLLSLRGDRYVGADVSKIASVAQNVAGALKGIIGKIKKKKKKAKKTISDISAQINTAIATDGTAYTQNPESAKSGMLDNIDINKLVLPAAGIAIFFLVKKMKSRSKK